MKPPQKSKTEYEKVIIGEFIYGKIADIQYDLEHTFKFQGKEKIAPAIRFIFKLGDYHHNHYSRWMNFNVGEKSNLYNKYMVKLIEGIKPDADIDLDILKGMEVKTLWNEKNDFQFIESIFAAQPKIQVETAIMPVSTREEEEPPLEEDPPF